MLSQLAFVDIETTGLSPTTDRIAEIGVITVDGDRTDRWTTLIKTPTDRAYPEGVPNPEDAPRFADIAPELAARLCGRLFVAHNARFDHSFLRAEFERVGVVFDPQVLCSVMLSRKLYPRLARHDLDSLSEHHALNVETRHRALPDADLVWQWWQVVHRQKSHDAIARAIEVLLAGPVLPSQLDASLIDRLPRSPGAYIFHGEDDEPLVVGAAHNLRLHVVNYFRLDQASDKALEYAHRVTNITWRRTRGMFGAQLRAAELDEVLFANARRRRNDVQFTWQLSPAAIPCIALVPISAALRDESDSFGLFATERKAHNALVRLAARYRLCHGLLGISHCTKSECSACPVDQNAAGCVGHSGRKKELVRLFSALRAMRVPPWPHRGPVGIREQGDLHIVDRWQFLGTAQRESDVHELLQLRPREFDRRMFRLLRQRLVRVPPNEIVDLRQYAMPMADACDLVN